MSGTILVTGGGGFMASHLIERLLRRGCSVICLDRFDPLAMKDGNLAAIRNADDLHAAVGDILDTEFLNRTFSAFAVDAVVHLAAEVNLRASVENYRRYIDTNITGTANLLSACGKHGVPRFVFASSDSVYSDVQTIPTPEHERVQPRSPYAASKAAAEIFCSTFAHLFGLTAVAFRLFSPYGPRQRSELAVATFTRQIDSGDEVTIYGDGSSQRDYTYVADVCTGIEAALERPLQGFHTLNLSGGRPISLLYLVQLIEQNLGKKANLRFLPPRREESPILAADLTRIRTTLGYSPQVPIEEGIRRYVQWYQSQSVALESPSRD